MTRHRPHPAPRTEHGRALVTRHVVAHLTGRHVDNIRRWVTPVACDVRSRAALLDLDAVDAELDRHGRT